MSLPLHAVWLVILGAVLGALVVLVWRARGERARAIETELLRARLKGEETLSAEREQALERAREQLQTVFGDLARDSLQSNSEVFLQLARERLARQQLDASQALKERETAIESLVRPIREALAIGRRSPLRWHPEMIKGLYRLALFVRSRDSKEAEAREMQEHQQNYDDRGCEREQYEGTGSGHRQSIHSSGLCRIA